MAAGKSLCGELSSNPLFQYLSWDPRCAADEDGRNLPAHQQRVQRGAIDRERFRRLVRGQQELVRTEWLWYRRFQLGHRRRRVFADWDDLLLGPSGTWHGVVLSGGLELRGNPVFPRGTSEDSVERGGHFTRLSPAPMNGTRFGRCRGVLTTPPLHF